jgi:hypothetical protein
MLVQHPPWIGQAVAALERAPRSLARRLRRARPCEPTGMRQPHRRSALPSSDPPPHHGRWRECCALPANAEPGPHEAGEWQPGSWVCRAD